MIQPMLKVLSRPNGTEELVRAWRDNLLEVNPIITEQKHLY